MSALAVPKRKQGVHPHKFALWLGIASIVMMFSGLTSAYIVRKAGGNWTEFKLPDLFWISTIVIILSSVTLYLAHKAAKEEAHSKYRLWLGCTLLLGFGFVVMQYLGWQALMNIGVLLVGNPSGSFLYVISGVHALHVVAGVAILFVLFIKSMINRQDPVTELLDEINPHRTLGIEMASTYWHFVGILWIYLFLFFMYI